MENCRTKIQLTLILTCSQESTSQKQSNLKKNRENKTWCRFQILKWNFFKLVLFKNFLSKCKMTNYKLSSRMRLIRIAWCCHRCNKLTKNLLWNGLQDSFSRIIRNIFASFAKAQIIAKKQLIEKQNIFFLGNIILFFKRFWSI